MLIVASYIYLEFFFHLNSSILITSLLLKFSFTREYLKLLIKFLVIRCFVVKSFEKRIKKTFRITLNLFKILVTKMNVFFLMMF